MKHIFYKVSIFILLGLTSVSCNDFLNVQPDNFISAEQLFSTQKGANNALTGIYQELNNSYLYGRYMINDLDIMSNDLCWSAATSPNGLACWAQTSADPTVSGIWAQLYVGVDRSNVFLDHVNTVPNLNDSTRKSWTAQAKFLRALFYYNLVQNWGAVPLKLTETLSPQDIHIPVSPATAVFNAIHADLDSAIKYLPNRSQYPLLERSSRPSKTTAMALQARAYLRQAGVPFNIDPQNSYTQAAIFAGNVIGSGIHTLNPSFKQVFLNLLTDQYDNVYNENLMEVEFNSYTAEPNGNNSAGFPGIGAPLKYNGTDIIMVGSANRVTRKLFNLYEKGYTTTVTGVITYYYPTPIDERRDWTIQEYTLSGNTFGAAKTPYAPKLDTGNPLNDATHIYYRDNLNEVTVQPGRYVGKWRRDLENAGTLTAYGSPCNFPLIRYSEVLLIFAEADVMAKNIVTPEALSAINAVKSRAKASIIAANDKRAIDPNLFILELRDERARELFGEGHRRHDLIRWGILNDTFANLPMDDPTISYWGRSIQGAKFNLLPYPEIETSKNNAMKGLQNPGW